MSLTNILIREAREADLPAIIAMFAADDLGGHGDTTHDDAFEDYRNAFLEIQASPAQTLYVAERDGQVLGTFQAIITTSMSGRGSSSMIIEAVQTRADMRGQGIGAEMIGFCIDRARRGGMRLVQLSSNAVRKDAHRFYERLGFRASHLGFKMSLK